MGGAARDCPLLIDGQRCCRTCYESGNVVPNDPSRPNSPYCTPHRRERSSALQSEWRARKRAASAPPARPAMGAPDGLSEQVRELLQSVATDLEDIAEAFTHESSRQGEAGPGPGLPMTRKALAGLPELAASLRAAAAEARPC
jgi:hypothetical protein